MSEVSAEQAPGQPPEDDDQGDLEDGVDNAGDIGAAGAGSYRL